MPLPPLTARRTVRPGAFDLRLIAEAVEVIERSQELLRQTNHLVTLDEGMIRARCG